MSQIKISQLQALRASNKKRHHNYKTNKPYILPNNNVITTTRKDGNDHYERQHQ